MLTCLLYLGLSAPPAQAAEPDALVRGLMGIWETGDTEGLEEIAHTDLIYDDVPNGNTIEGREGAAQYIRHVHSWASNVELEIVGVSSGPTTATLSGSCAVCRTGPSPAGFRSPRAGPSRSVEPP